ncbi:MAG: EAL domain-containing protein [Gammaproteobacteria bacterium]|nr:EAL domain-containing protein [Gammaproteobacteria bacterium]MDH3430103.1 EAL domain-containing protein [Gammaproteobacteria bacterium]MDH3432460.1 EAL domain-containing protein [Gammaproteobacteria bacterium]
MSTRLLGSLSMAKYERLLPRVFPGAVRIDIRDRNGALFWSVRPGENGSEADGDGDDDPVVAWTDFGPGIKRRQLPSRQLQFRAALQMRQHGHIAWLIVAYDLQPSVPMATAPEPLRRAFSDAKAFLQEELELQAECNQLAVELTERYEELNLMYSTEDHVEHLEESQEALTRLVHNCADYLDVGAAALISRERNLMLHSTNSTMAPEDVDGILELLGTAIYDRVEAQVSSLVLNETDDLERQRLFAGRSENLLAMPVVDDHGTSIGIIAVIVHGGRVFSNGDRNLLEVMAKKASRIIHTHHDSLTGLMNRSGFEPTLVSALTNARTKGGHYCLLHIDIDQLHVINDLMGHQEGDALIRRVAKVLRGTLRDSDVLARLGGDEFAVLATNCDIRQGHSIADKIRMAVRELTVVSANRQLDVSVSLGVAAIDAQTDGIVGVMASAEIACKAAKDGGRDRIQVFEKDNTSLVRRSEEIEWIGRVQQALREDMFELHCQPVAPLASDRWPTHYEILIRLIDDEGIIHSPGLFMPAAERYQLMPQVDRWVIQNTLRTVGKIWKIIADTGSVFCINLSGQSLTNTGFLTFVIDEIDRSPIDSNRICFEITETAAISNIDEATLFIEALRAKGCRFALDDFGAGLSSFGYLKVLPVDYLKIDGSFVCEVTTDDVSLSMVEAICQIGRTMGLQTIAEYVGNDETIEVLRGIGVDYVQGFHIGMPVPLKQILGGLRRGGTAATA